jgi:hypothetical protein
MGRGRLVECDLITHSMPSMPEHPLAAKRARVIVQKSPEELAKEVVYSDFHILLRCARINLISATQALEKVEADYQARANPGEGQREVLRTALAVYDKAWTDLDDKQRHIVASNHFQAWKIYTTQSEDEALKEIYE